MDHRISAGALVVNDDTILLVRHYKPNSYDFWVAPGGGVMATEDIYTAAKREAFEETGLSIEPLRLAYIEELFTPQTRHCKFWLFSKLLGGELSTEALEAKKEYIVDAQFISRTAFQGKIVFPSILHEQFWQDIESGFPKPKYLGIHEMKFY